jgi:hypothetical protein
MTTETKPEPKFKIGDYVEYNDPFTRAYGIIDQIEYIDHIKDYSYWSAWDIDSEKRERVHAEYLTLIKSAEDKDETSKVQGVNMTTETKSEPKFKVGDYVKYDNGGPIDYGIIDQIEYIDHIKDYAYWSAWEGNPEKREKSHERYLTLVTAMDDRNKTTEVTQESPEVIALKKEIESLKAELLLLKNTKLDNNLGNNSWVTNDDDYSLTITSISLHSPKESCIFGENNISISLADTGSGLYIKLNQPKRDSYDSSFTMDFKEVKMIEKATEYLRNQKSIVYSEVNKI